MSAELHKAIRAAIKAGDIDFITTTFEENPSVVTMNTPFGSWLHVAASFGKLEIVQSLVERFRMDINSKGGTSNSSPLDRACADGHSIRYSGKSMHDMSAIDFAKERGADEFVSLLGE